MLRYVILHHQLPADAARATHWDLMLEADDVLRTWALPCEPEDQFDCVAEQLADHRRDYLDYEGPVSRGRGEVARWDEGEYQIERDSGQELVVRLAGRRLRGTLRLTRGAPRDDGSYSWRVVFSAEPTRG